jgi:putative tricarboxylic transport membrane protein
LTRNAAWAGVFIGLGLLGIAAIIGFDAMNMRVPPVHAKVGPRVFPYIVAIGMALAGLVLLWQSRTGESVPRPEGETDWTAVAVIAAGLIIHLNILKPLGFIPAGILLFMCVAFAFGSRKILRDLAIGVVVVSVTYVSFTRLLGLQLPPGLLQGII